MNIEIPIPQSVELSTTDLYRYLVLSLGCGFILRDDFPEKFYLKFHADGIKLFAKCEEPGKYILIDERGDLVKCLINLAKEIFPNTELDLEVKERP